MQVAAAPTAVLTAPSAVACGTTVTLNGSQSTAGSGAQIIEYRWQFDTGGPVVATQTPTITHSYTEMRLYRPSLVIQDDLGQISNPVVRAISVGTTGVPTAILTAPAVVAAGQPVTASGSNSVDPDASCGDRIIDYVFSVDGGNPIVRDTPLHTFTGLSPGTHTITLSVRDTSGNHSTPTSRQVQVAAAPTAVLSAPSAVACGTTVTLNGSQSIAGSGAQIIEYRWSLENGGPVIATAASSITHTYTTAGGHRPSLVVQDNLGQLSQPVTRIIGVGTTGVPIAVLTAANVSRPGRPGSDGLRRQLHRP